MVFDFTKVTVGVVVEADLDAIEVADGTNKVVANVQLVTEEIVATAFVEAVSVVDVVHRRKNSQFEVWPDLDINNPTAYAYAG